MRRHHPKGHQIALLGQRDRRLDAALKRGHVADRMVGGQHQQQRVITGLPGQQRRTGNRRGGIAPFRFEYDTRRLIPFAQLFGHQETMAMVANDHGGRSLETGQPRKRLLQQTVSRGQAQELLGHLLPRERPQASAATAA